jgi:hypothetical protein
VRVCAPMAFRVRVLMDRLGTNDAGAVREQIERHDACRVRTMRAYFNVEQEDARSYQPTAQRRYRLPGRRVRRLTSRSAV